MNAEYGLQGRVTTKGDVYSYGILLLEILTKKRPTHNMFVEGMTLQKWASIAFPNQVGKVVDKSLLRSTISKRINKENELDCATQLLSVGLSCTKESPQERPSMIDIVSTLQKIRETV